MAARDQRSHGAGRSQLREKLPMKLFTTHDIGTMLGVSATSIAKWVDKGLLKAFTTPGGHRRIWENDLRVFLAEQRIPLPQALQEEVFRLLVVDDDRTTLNALKRALYPLGDAVQLTSTPSWVDAMLMLPQLRPHAVLLGLNIPGLDALEACRQIRGRQELAGLRLFAVGAQLNQTQADASRAAGAEPLAKPLDTAHLFRLLGLTRPG